MNRTGDFIAWGGAAALAVLLAAVPGEAELLRGVALAVAGLGVWVTVRIWRDGPRWVVGLPVFQAAWLALLFFALLPLLLPEDWRWAQTVSRLAWAVEGGLALRLILGFSVGGLAAALWLASRRRQAQNAVTAPELGLASAAAISLTVAGLCGAYAVLKGTGRLDMVLGGELARQALDAVPMITSAALVLLSMAMVRRPVVAMPLLLLFLALAAAMVSHVTVKLIFLIGGAALLAHLAFAARPLRKLCVMGLLAAVIAGVGFHVMFIKRYSNETRGTLAETLSRGVEIKLGERFAITHLCLARALQQKWNMAAGEPFYYAQALIPRAVWPNKSSLSGGNDIAKSYCTAGNYVAADQSSMSVTLLGEPVIMAGWVGLVAALPAMLGVLVLVPLWLSRWRSVGVPVLMASSPWLMDFDQQFAIYLALGVKAVIISAATILFCLWLDRRIISRSSARPPFAPTL